MRGKDISAAVELSFTGQINTLTGNLFFFHENITSEKKTERGIDSQNFSKKEKIYFTQREKKKIQRKQISKS